MAIDKEKMEKRYRNFLSSVAGQMEIELKRQARISQNWNGFDNPTKRANGDVVTNPRNIVDKGEFINGIRRNGDRIDFTAPHSIYVIKGYRTRSTLVPGRDIIEKARQEVVNGNQIQTNLDD